MSLQTNVYIERETYIYMYVERDTYGHVTLKTCIEMPHRATGTGQKCRFSQDPTVDL